MVIETTPHHDYPDRSDPFACRALRERVLAAWAASPARFREDANAEEDLALGGYRDRVLVELAQNAADAAAAADIPGHLRLTLATPAGTDPGTSPTLVAANTGAPLTADGVQALATLRASAKRTDGSEPGNAAVGRFGVGFAAVLAVTDEPLVLSRSGGVRFSRADCAALVEDTGHAAPGLAEEVRRRAGHVPALRLPFEAEGKPPEGFDTAVILPLRDEGAAELVRRMLAEVDDTLLLALPGLDRVEIDAEGDSRVVEDAERRWHVLRTGGTFSAAERERLLADRPTEERSRPTWSLLWALPKAPPTARPTALPTDGGAELPGVVHAPTPTEEPVSLPALLLASFPLDPTRRHVATGPLTDRLVAEAAAAYAELARARAEDGGDTGGYTGGDIGADTAGDIGRLVPTGLAAGALDGALREAIVRRLADTPLLADVEDAAVRTRPRDAVVLDGIEDADPALLRLLAPVIGGLVVRPSGGSAVLDALGVRRIGLADLVDELATVAEAYPPSWWHELYAALAPAVRSPETREALGALPVPLADERVVQGARGLLLQGTGEEIATGAPVDALGVLAPYGLRVVHPEAAHEALATLGATEASARTVLEDGAVRAAVDGSPDADDPDVLAGAVLAVVAAARAGGGLEPGELSWLGDLALRDADGELAPAGVLVIPGSPAEAVLDPDEFGPVDGALVERWGVPVLAAVGVLRTLGLVTVSDVDTEVASRVAPDELADLDDLTGWLAGAPRGILGELTAVRDLDCVAAGSWPQALRMFATEPDLRRTLLTAARVARPSGEVAQVPPYTAWWIRRHVLAGGHPLPGLADPDADAATAAVLPSAPGWLADLPSGVRAALGLVQGLADLAPESVSAVLARLADETVDLDPGTLRAVWAGLAGLAGGLDGSDGLDVTVDPPDRVRVLRDGRTKVVGAPEAVVVDAPMWLQRTDLGGFVVAPEAAAENLADLLDLPLASERADGIVDEPGRSRDVPEPIFLVLPEAPERWWSHDELTVDGCPVDWWVDGPADGDSRDRDSHDGCPHAVTEEGLARALAWTCGHWSRRHLVAAVLADPDRAAALSLEMAYDEDASAGTGPSRLDPEPE